MEFANDGALRARIYIRTTRTKAKRVEAPVKIKFSCNGSLPVAALWAGGFFFYTHFNIPETFFLYFFTLDIFNVWQPKGGREYINSQLIDSPRIYI